MALLVGAALLLGLAQTAVGRDALDSLGVRNDDGGFTELSFAQPGDLPRRMTEDVVVKVPFFIRNRETGPRAYRWVVEQHSGARTRVLASGSTATTAVGRAAYVSPELALPCDRVRSQAVVRVVGIDQSIDFWTKCSPAAAHAG